MAAKNSMFEPEDTDILQDMYGTDAGRLTEQQEDMFGTGHESATGACSETFGAEADSPKLAKLRWKRGFGQGARAQSRARRRGRTVRARPPGKAGGQRRFCWPARQLWCCFGPRPSLWKVEVTP